MCTAGVSAGQLNCVRQVAALLGRSVVFFVLLLFARWRHCYAWRATKTSSIRLYCSLLNFVTPAILVYTIVESCRLSCTRLDVQTRASPVSSRVKDSHVTGLTESNPFNVAIFVSFQASLQLQRTRRFVRLAVNRMPFNAPVIIPPYSAISNTDGGGGGVVKQWVQDVELATSSSQRVNTQPAVPPSRADISKVK